MMSKKDYEEIAKVLAAELSVNTGSASRQHPIRMVTYSLADKFIQSNPRFDREVFYNAVGI